MRLSSQTHLRVFLLSLTLLPGCSILAPLPDPSHFYLLSAEGDTSQVSRPDLRIGVGPIDLPAYLDRNEIVTHSGANQVALSANQRWAEPLEENIARVVASNLSRSLGTEMVFRHPWLRSTSLDYQVEIEILDLGWDTTGLVRLATRWTLHDGTSGGTLLVGSSERKRSARESITREKIRALSNLLSETCNEIASSILEQPEINLN